MLEHSEIKVKLLRLYLDRYLNVLTQSQYIGDIYVYDLFCGEGIYEDDGKGSPIVMLEAIKSIYFGNKAGGVATDKFHCSFNDISVSKVENLQNEIRTRRLHYAEMGNLNFTAEDYRKLLPSVIEEINSFTKQKAFVFIDPYGYKDIRISDISNLLQSRKSEVLLFLPTQFMFRFETKGTPESLVEFIDELMPVEQWPVSETGIDFIQNLTEAFRNALGSSFFVDSFIITRNKNQFFCLFFFTSHIYGFDRMLDVKWQIDEEEGRGWRFDSGDSLFDQIEVKANTSRFERKLIDFLKVERTNAQLYEFRLHNGHLATHAYDILKKLQAEGKLLSVKGDGTPARKSAFYLDYKNYRDEPNKIKIKLR